MLEQNQSFEDLEEEEEEVFETNKKNKIDAFKCKKNELIALGALDKIMIVQIRPKASEL